MQRDPLVHLVERKRPDARTGKGAALNVGYNTLSSWLPADADRDHTIVAVVDADGILAPNAFRQAAGPQAFGDPATGAAQAAVWMSQPQRQDPAARRHLEGGAGVGPLPRAHAGHRVPHHDRRDAVPAPRTRSRSVSAATGSSVASRRSTASSRSPGDPWHGSLLEDYELGIHVMLVGYRTSYMHDTHVEQEALPSTRRLLTQRTRWCQGGMQCTRYLPGIFQSQHFTNAGALEATYFLLVPFIQLLGLVLWPAAFIAMAAAGSINSGGFIEFMASAWWLLPLVVLTGIVPFAIWAPIYRKQAQPDASIGQTVLWGLGYWLYMYQNYICVIRAFIRLITGKDGWTKTRRNAEEGTKLLARDT